jgi:HPr kinase/phosphorylase
MTPPAVTVAGVLSDRPDSIGLPITLLAGAAGLERVISSPHIQKTGLALAGFHEYLQPQRILVLGESEVRYLESLDPAERSLTLERAFNHDIPCVLITGGWTAPHELTEAADRCGVPLLWTSVATPLAIAKVFSLLDDALATREVVHGVLMDILGLGVLIVGESGIGKSECALDLVVRGHRLVADDAVQVHRRGETVLIGTCPELTRHHIEIRGLGIINVHELFGVASTRNSKRLELVVELQRRDPAREYDRLGVEERHYDLFGVNLPFVSMPVAPGRNIAILVEVAARAQLLRSRGLSAARRLAARLDSSLRTGDTDVQEDDETEPGGAL